jgi:hypothetical protein
VSVHNYVLATLACPRCGESAEMEIETFFGPIDLERYRVGDRVRWFPRKQVQNGGRPPDGDLYAEGYLVCPICELDSFVKVHIRSDVVAGVSPDTEKAPYLYPGQE